jgi:glycosyltransferase involved in cell wall biosynthesis
MATRTARRGGARPAAASDYGEPSPLRVAVLAPPWIPVPPREYGGIERVIATLSEALVRRGHEVTLFAARGSRSSARLVTILEEDPPDAIGRALFEADHVAGALKILDAERLAGRPFDVIHDHCDAVTVAVADRIETPVVHTLHGPFTAHVAGFHRRHAGNALLVGLSAAQLRDAPSGARVHGAVPNPLDVSAFRYRGEPGEYLAWLGRFAPEKGAQRAIEVARAAGVKLVLAGVVQPGQSEFFDEHVAPHVDGERVVYAGPVGGERKQRLLERAAALLMPIRWPEPFGMVMVEAMACGTPVVAFREGSAPEVVSDGVSGLLVDDVAEMADAVRRLPGIDRASCRRWARRLCDPAKVAQAYERAYRSAIGARAGGPAATGAA